MLLTFVVGFAILGYLALRVQSEHAPVPGRVVDETGRLLMTRDEILQGQEAFLTHGLMQFGSVYGHGAYLGPDFTADYLHRQAELMRKYYGGGPDAEEKVRRELQTNRYDEKTDTLVWTNGQARAFRELLGRYEEEFLNRKRSGAGLGPGAIPDAEDRHRITAFIAWTAWTETDVGRFHQWLSLLTAASVAAVSLVALLEWAGRPGTGLMMVAFLTAAGMAVRDARSVWRSAGAPENDGPG
jgi:nitric oxide reductase subunit B